jgi:uncharacterized protein
LGGFKLYICGIWIDLHLVCEPGSLKGKRHVIKSLKDRLWNKFRVSVSEVGANNLWQRAEIGIAYVTSDGVQGEQMFSKITDLIDSDSDVEIIDIRYEIEKF